MNRNDDAFDARLRATWHVAVDAVPPTLAWRLRTARPRTGGERAPARWPLGAALAVAAVLAIAIGLRPHAVGTPNTTPAATSVVASNTNDATASLDRSPDFYAWLASPDAEQLAME